jgi:hypothetical protein
LGLLGVVDVGNPAMVGFHRVYRQGQHLDIAAGKFLLQFGGGTQFGGAHRGVIRRMGKQHGPAVTLPLMEMQFANGGLLAEIRSDVAKSQSHAGFLYGVIA